MEKTWKERYHSVAVLEYDKYDVSNIIFSAEIINDTKMNLTIVKNMTGQR